MYILWYMHEVGIIVAGTSLGYGIKACGLRPLMA